MQFRVRGHFPLETAPGVQFPGDAPAASFVVPHPEGGHIQANLDIASGELITLHAIGDLPQELLEALDLGDTLDHYYRIRGEAGPDDYRHAREAWADYTWAIERIVQPAIPAADKTLRPKIWPTCVPKWGSIRGSTSTVCVPSRAEWRHSWAARYPVTC